MTNTASDHAAYRVLIDEFVAVLNKAARNRKNDAGDLEPDPVTGVPELSFVLRERRAMLEAVNTYRSGRGLPPTDLQVVMTAESRALGHSDYATKWAIGCADIVYDLHPEAQQAPTRSHHPSPAAQKAAE